MGSFLRYVKSFVANSSQSRSAVHSSSCLPILSYFFIGVWQSLVFVYLCPRVVGTASDFSKRGYRFPFSTKWVWPFVSGGVVFSFFRGLVFVIGFSRQDTAIIAVL